MKKNYILIFFLMLFACNANPSPDVLKEKLKSAMTTFLYKRVNFDSSKVKYKVQDVIYYDDKEKNYYDCQFKVLMSVPNKKDTVGFMFAYISKDFKDIKRAY
jgi:hypothetical protein